MCVEFQNINDNDLMTFLTTGKSFKPWMYAEVCVCVCVCMCVCVCVCVHVCVRERDRSRSRERVCAHAHACGARVNSSTQTIHVPV